MRIINTKDPCNKPPLVMLLYGQGGVGKTTFASTAPKPILADFENGTKYFGLRGLEMDVAQIENWMEFAQEFTSVVKTGEYETIIIDPIGEAMEKLILHLRQKRDKKLVQIDGSPTMAGWGWLKDNLRTTIKILRAMNKNLLIIAHVEEKDDDGRLVKRPKVQTKLSEELVNMVDVVGYMTIAQDPETDNLKRVILVDPESDKYIAKDRSGQLGTVIEPDFKKIIEACAGAEYNWTKPKEEQSQNNQIDEKLKKANKKSNDKQKNIVSV
jgi:phage nucleotide-binding protein